MAGLLTAAPKVLACITVAQQGVGFLQSVHNTFQEMRSNPGKVKSEELKKCREESQAAYDKSVKEMEDLRKAIDESSKKSEESANNRFKEQQDLNNSAIQAIEKRLKESEEMYDEEHKKMMTEHEKQMRELRDASKEEREKAEREHKEKMEKLEKKHDGEKKEATLKLENTRKEGALKIAEASAQKEAVIAERTESLKTFDVEMKKLMDEHQKLLNEINKEALEMRKENSRLRVENLKKENETTLEQIKARTDELLKHYSQEHSREVIQHFKGVVEKVEESQNSLRYITTMCQNPMSIAPGEVDPDIREIERGIPLYQDRVKRYRQFCISATHAHPTIRETCAVFIEDMNKVMNDCNLLQITLNLPKAIDSGNSEEITKYGEMAKEMYDQFDKVNKSVQGKLDGITMSHFQEPMAITDRN